MSDLEDIPDIVFDNALPATEQAAFTAADLKTVRAEISDKNKYNMVEAEQRNVLFVGRARSGKSTAYKTIVNCCYEPPTISIFASEAEAQCRALSLRCNIENGVETNYTLNIIDTPGLFKVKANGEKPMTKDAILDQISLCIKQEITRIHCVVMFATVKNGINEQDIEAIETFSDMFHAEGDKTKMFLCFTRAESMTSARRNAIIKEVGQLKKLAPIVKHSALQILFMGAVDVKENIALTDKVTLRAMYTRVYNYRYKLLKAILAADKPVAVPDLKIVKKKMDEMLEKLVRVKENFARLQSVNDAQLQNSRELAEEQVQLLNDIKDYIAYGNFKSMLKPFKEAMDAAKVFHKSQAYQLFSEYDLVGFLFVNEE